jgi:hypothetical protein
MKWLLNWTDRTAVIVASGPSAIEAPLDLVKGVLHTIVVNDSWKLAPWADVLFACDERWWFKNNGLPEFHGLKIAASTRCKDFDGVHYVPMQGNNSGFGAVRLAILYGAKRIILVGFDMHQRSGLHWHGEHPTGLRNATAEKMERWREEMDRAARKYGVAGLEIINTSRDSALTRYPYRPFIEAVSNANSHAHRSNRQGCPVAVG